MAATKITVRNDGSIRVEGDFEILDQDGTVIAWTIDEVMATVIAKLLAETKG